MESSGTWVISRSGRGFLVEDSRARRGGRLGELGVSGGRKWDTVEAWGHHKGGLTPGERSLRGEDARNGENRSVYCEEVAS